MFAKIVRAYQLRFPFGVGAAAHPLTLDERIAIDRPTMRGYSIDIERGPYQHRSLRQLYTYTTKNSATLFMNRPWEMDLIQEPYIKAALRHMVRDQNGIGCEGLSKWQHVVLEVSEATFHITITEAKAGDTIRMRWTAPSTSPMQ